MFHPERYKYRQHFQSLSTMSEIHVDPRKVFIQKEKAINRLASRPNASLAQKSLAWLIEMIGDPSLLPGQYRRLFVRPGSDGGETYGPVSLRYKDRYNLVMFCLVNGLDPARMHEFMESHGAYDGKEERRYEVDTLYRSLSTTSKEQQSAYSVSDHSYVFLNGEPDHKKNKQRGASAVSYTFLVDPITGRKTHYREHIIVGKEMWSRKQPEWVPMCST